MAEEREALASAAQGLEEERGAPAPALALALAEPTEAVAAPGVLAKEREALAPTARGPALAAAAWPRAAWAWALA